MDKKFDMISPYIEYASLPTEPTVSLRGQVRLRPSAGSRVAIYDSSLYSNHLHKAIDAHRIDDDDRSIQTQLVASTTSRDHRLQKLIS
jgi:hypothetical protein